jgi:hypothetical protein
VPFLGCHASVTIAIPDLLGVVALQVNETRPHRGYDSSQRIQNADVPYTVNNEALGRQPGRHRYRLFTKPVLPVRREQLLPELL